MKSSILCSAILANAVNILASDWLAVENVAMLKLQSLFALCVGLPGANLGDLPNNYANSTRCREFVMALSNTLKGKLWEGILSSPYVAVAIDESTDITTSENLIIYITYIHKGRTHVSYVGLGHAPAVDAESIHHQLLEYLEDNGLDMSRVMCFCSDGASVMTGSQNGVGVRLQRSSNPFMLCIHCIAHRLALCCADTATDMDYPENEESTLNEVSAYFNRSGKRTSKLQALAKELKISQTKIVKSGKTRWLSRAGCVAVVIKLFSALVQVFTTDKNEADNEVAGVLLTSVSTYMFVAVLVAMGDFLPLLSTLSQTFQHDVIDYSTVQARLGEVRCQIIEDFLQFKDDAKQLSVDASQQEWNDAWHDQLSCDSEMFKRPTSILLSELLKEDACFRGVELEGCTDGTQSQAMLWIHKFALAIMSRLDERFPKDDMKILQAMEILNPQKMPEGANRLGGYGDAEIDVIINHYGEASGGVAAAMDGDALRRQWRLFKHTLHTYKQRGVAMRDAFAELLPPMAKHGELPSEIEKLICLKLIMTLNTACCERGFSRMKLIKTYLRNRLYIETLDALMTIAMVGPEFVDLSCASDPTLADALVAWETSACATLAKLVSETNVLQRRKLSRNLEQSCLCPPVVTIALRLLAWMNLLMPMKKPKRLVIIQALLWMRTSHPSRPQGTLFYSMSLRASTKKNSRAKR